MSLSTPTQITIPFANTGTRSAIPQAANNTTGRAGYDLGFPPINMEDLNAGGIPPFGQDVNGIFYDITLAEQFIQAGGSWPYNSTFATAIGGYPLGALVQRSDSSGFWRNTVANNTTDPDAGGANWVPEDSGSTSIAMSSSNVTLTALQAAKPIIVITGTLTANLNLIFPNYAKTWTVINSATGNFSITCKTATGTGVSVATGFSIDIVCNGTNSIFSDASQGPAFCAFSSVNVSFGGAVPPGTKIAFDSESFDTDNCFSTSLSRFTPTVKGLYQINFKGSATCTSGSPVNVFVRLMKNGTSISDILVDAPTSNYISVSFSELVSMNGSTDYLEIFGSAGGGGTVVSLVGTSVGFKFSGSLARRG
jgi:hypothetical protein